MQNNTFPTLFVGQNLIILPEVDSTNNYLKSLLSNSEPLPEGTVIMAGNQFAGRGQHQNVWISESGKNLTISTFLKPNFLVVDKQFELNTCLSLAIVNAVSNHLSIDCKIKWPNDIFYKNKKMGGMLIENVIAGSQFKFAIVGIGLNVNQTTFEGLLSDSATSLKNILKKKVVLIELLRAICIEIEKCYLTLKSGGGQLLREQYTQHLYRFDEIATYRQNGEEFVAILKGVTKSGQLILQKGGVDVYFNFKEVEFIIT